MHQQGILRTLGWTLIAFSAAFAGAVQAAANVQSLRGDVRVGNQTVNTNDRITSGATITTGAGAQAVLRFDDGQQVVLNENTSFRIAEFRYREAEPRNDRAIFELVRGALRVVTGIVGSRNQLAFQMRVPQATIGIRGTDFMVALVNPAFVSVLGGAVGVTNAAGTVVFGAGSIGSVATASSLAVAIPASALPAAASAAFTNLSAAGVVGGAAAGAGVEGAAVGAAPGAGTAAIVGGVAAGAAAAASDAGATTTHHPVTP